MTLDELEYKESVLRECFLKHLDELDVNGTNDMCKIKEIKTFGALWHYTHQLLLAETEHSSVTTTDTMEIKATGLKMAGGKNA